MGKINTFFAGFSRILIFEPGGKGGDGIKMQDNAVFCCVFAVF
jgi:hypothetical protein